MKNKTYIKTIDGLDIYFEALEEFIPLSELLPDHTEQELQNVIENNDIFCAEISAYLGSVKLSETYLGGCIYENQSDFYTKYKDEYLSDMISKVVEESKKELKELRESIEKVISQ